MQGRELGLSAIERQAVEVGLRDADGGRAVPSGRDGYRARLARLSRVITGQRGRQPLADAKLELIREFAYRTRQGRRADEQLIPALMKHGYGPDRINTLAALAA